MNCRQGILGLPEGEMCRKTALRGCGLQKPQFSQGQALCPAVQAALPLTFSLRGLSRLLVQSIRHAATKGTRTVGVCSV